MLLADLASGMRVSPSTSPLSSARAACVALWRAPGFMPAGLPLQPGANRPPCPRPALSGLAAIGITPADSGP